MGFNVLISMLIQLGFDRCTFQGQVNLLVAIFAGMLAAAVVYTGDLFFVRALSQNVSNDESVVTLRLL